MKLTKQEKRASAIRSVEALTIVQKHELILKLLSKAELVYTITPEQLKNILKTRT